MLPSPPCSFYACPAPQTKALCPHSWTWSLPLPHSPSHPPQLTYSFNVMVWRAFAVPKGLARFDL